MRSSSGEARYAPVVSASAEVDAEGRVARAAEIAARLRENIETVVHGKTEEIRLVLSALACGGHVLFEDVPGTAKTVLARAIAQSVEGAIPSRIQCTPDLQPNDVTGLSIYNQKVREFEFQPGPIFANVVLVDEINRAMPKTQAALLEAMAEQQVTTDGLTRRLPSPFLLLATENPIEYEGTFPLPEAQLDRFFLKTSLGYPSLDDELLIIDDQREHHPLATLGPVVTVEEVEQLSAAVRDVYLDPLLGALDRRARARDPRVARGGGRRLRPREPRARAGRARLGAPPRPRVRHPGRRRAPLPAGPRSPGRLHAEDAGGRPAHRLGRRAGRVQGVDPGGDPAAVERLRVGSEEPAAG